MILFLHLYYTFFKIALFTFGGGYAMIALYQQELVTRAQYLSPHDFVNIVALAQMTPGPIGLNAATYVGYTVGLTQSSLPAPWGGILGSTIATLAVVTPSLIVTTLVAIFLHRFAGSRAVKAALAGIRPAVLGLIAAAVFVFADASIFSAPLKNLWTGNPSAISIHLPALLIFALTLLTKKFLPKLGILPILFTAALLGMILL